MRKKTTWFGMTGILVRAVLLGAFSQSGEDLFQKALRLERNEGKLMEAIELYNKVVAEGGNEALAAQSQLRIGLCYEKMGKAEAIKAYELVLKNYAGQAKQVAAARRRLAALKAKKPSDRPSTRLSEGMMAAMSMSLSPDGKKLAVMDVSKGQNIAAFDLSSKQLYLMTNYTWAKGSLITHSACWSPDGKEMVFHQSTIDPEGPAEIAVSDSDGNTRVIYQTTNRKGGYPVPYEWLAKGSAILACFFHEDATGTLGLVPLSGEPFKPLYKLKSSVEKMVPVADASQDGRFVVFQERNSQGKHDLYIIGTNGSSLTVLSDHPSDERIPRWSPDGKHIVFLSQRHGTWALWGIAVSEGKPVGEPFFIKEGNYQLLNWTKQGLLFKKMIVLQDIFTVSIDPDSLEIKGKPRQIEYTPTGSNYGPSWSPDGKYLAFVTSNFNDSSRERKIVVLSIETGEYQEFSNPDSNQQQNAIHDLRWLPDGSGLSLSGLDDDGKPVLFQVDFKNANAKWKTWPIPVKTWTRTEMGKDGKSFLFFRHGSMHDEPGIVEQNLVTGDERYVYKPERGHGNVFRQLKLSRDYTKLVFLEDNKLIKLIDIKTGKQRDLATMKMGQVAWSPDSEKLLSISQPEKPGMPSTLFLLSVNDGSTSKLDLDVPKGTTIYRPDWSPDGRRIAFGLQSAVIEIHLMKDVITK